MAAIDHEGEVLDGFVTKTRDKKAAPEFPWKAVKKHVPCECDVTDNLRSSGACMKAVGIEFRQETGRWLSGLAENSRLAFRRPERAILRFRRM